MNSAVIAFLTCLLVLCVQGQPGHSSSKCMCDSYVGPIHRRFIKGIPVIHNPSIYCSKTEIIITTTADNQKCVDPESRLGKHILEKMSKLRKNRAASTTTTSSQTSTQSSISLHTTSTM
ncbi:growth-regulated alpha protein-like [Scomber scombrus]|uniref:growth-regulated alpha protein-like n=1 Tax=Scomber scombrus TaxID=13677 RepID=UPI002DDC4D60|nr:growth-regulated alpha protein-like [Scomber scombrus]